jgi:hypothetical protein
MSRDKKIMQRYVHRDVFQVFKKLFEPVYRGLSKDSEHKPLYDKMLTKATKTEYS